MAVFLHFTAKTARRKQEIAEASGPSPLFAMGRRFWLSRLPGSRRVASLRLGLETAAYAASVSRPRSGPSPLFAAGRRFLEKFMDYLFFKCFLLWYNDE